ncbi:MAG TPA: MFS transporter [Alphaproteobacteria bacterium]|nr:MFS transporter [Alphaproteobacteria bacterium]
MERTNSASQPANLLVLILLLFSGVVSSLAFTAVGPGVPRIATYFAGPGDATFRAQLVLTMAPIGMAVGGITGARIIARLGVKRTLLLGYAGYGLFGMAPLVLNNLNAIYIARALTGWSIVTADVSLMLILGELYEGEGRSRILGFRQAIGSCSTVGGTLLSGWLIQGFGWRAPFWLFAIALVYVTLSALAFRTRLRPPERTSWRNLPTVAALWPLYAAMLVLAVAHAMPHFELPSLLVADGLNDISRVSWFPAASATVSILSATAFGWIYGRADRWMLVLLLVLMGLGLAGIGVAPSFTLVFVSVIVEGIGGGWMIPYMLNRMLDKAPGEIKSQAVGLMMSTMFVGQFLNPLVNKPLRDAFGLHGAFVAIGAVLLAIAAAVAVSALRPRPVEPRAANL